MEYFNKNIYKKFLQQFLDAGYDFIDYNSAKSYKDKKYILLRHDIDFDVKAALKLAKLEAEIGIKSTFFFMLRSSLYNVFDSENTKYINEIISLGHHLGIHFDRTSYPSQLSKHNISEKCNFEAKLLSDWFNIEVKIVSYHRPDIDQLSGDLKSSYPLINTYMKDFTKDILYRSDSRGTWKYGNPLKSESFSNGLPMQILIHPIWWHNNTKNSHDILTEYLKRRCEDIEYEIAKNCTIFRTGRWKEQFKNIK